MSFAGKYRLHSQENFEPFMRAIGLPEELIQKGKDFIEEREIEENGDTFKIMVTTGTNKVRTNTFTIGQESDLETFSGKKIKAVMRREGNKLMTSMNGIESLTELQDENTILDSLTVGDIEYKRILKRI